MNAALRIATPVENRRRYVRVEGCGLAGHLQTRDASIPGLAIENVSMGGLFVRSNAPLPVGTSVMLQLVRPGLRRALTLTGRVVSIVSVREAALRGAIAGMGIALTRPDGEVRARLGSLVEELAKRADPEAGAAVVESLPPMRLASASRVAEAPAPPAAPVAVAPVEVAPSEPANDHDDRVARLEAEVQLLRREILRRNRTIQELSIRLASAERAG
ncbi:MAG: PilZ domain-containing protein [Polyangiaceae bacterium]